MKALKRLKNASGASFVEYALLVNFFGLFLLIVTPGLNDGVRRAFTPMATTLHFSLGGGTTTDMTREQGGDPLEQCRRGVLPPSNRLCAGDEN